MWGSRRPNTADMILGWAASSPNVWYDIGVGQLTAPSSRRMAGVKMVKPRLQLGSEQCANSQSPWLCHGCVGQLTARNVWSRNVVVYQQTSQTDTGKVVFSCPLPKSTKWRMC